MGPEKQTTIDGKVVNCLKIGKKHEPVKVPNQYIALFKCKICGARVELRDNSKELV